MTNNREFPIHTILACMIALITAVGLFSAPAQASDTTSERLLRKVKVMQKVLDEVLAQSEHVVVSPGGVTRGLILEEYGVVFTFDANVGEDILFGRVWTVPEANTFLGDDTDLRDETRAPRPEKHPRDVEWTVKKKEARAKQKQDRAALEVELVDALLDYGVTLAELEDENWVTIAAFLGSGSWGLFGGNESENRLVVRAKMRDLRRFTTGSLTREEARATVVIEQ